MNNYTVKVRQSFPECPTMQINLPIIPHTKIKGYLPCGNQEVWWSYKRETTNPAPLWVYVILSLSLSLSLSLYLSIYPNRQTVSVWRMLNAWNPGSQTVPCNIYIYIYIYIVLRLKIGKWVRKIFSVEDHVEPIFKMFLHVQKINIQNLFMFHFE